jgi:hypothetical protein
MTFDLTSPLPTSEEYETPCAGRWVLFDSRKPDDQAQAVALCRTCKVQPACERLLADTLSSITMRAAVQGTWAGRTFTPPSHNPKSRAGHPPLGRNKKGDVAACEDCGLVGPIFCRDRCRPCYRRLDLSTVDAPPLSRHDLLEEWAAFPKTRDNFRDNARAFAEHIGRRHDSTERALLRNGINAATYLKD